MNIFEFFKQKKKGTPQSVKQEISNEFPEDFKYVNQLIALEEAKERSNENLSENEKQKDYLLGAVEAKKVYLDNRKWKRLLVDHDVV